MIVQLIMVLNVSKNRQPAQTTYLLLQPVLLPEALTINPHWIWVSFGYLTISAVSDLQPRIFHKVTLIPTMVFNAAA